jgi:hypothetical protein
MSSKAENHPGTVLHPSDPSDVAGLDEMPSGERSPWHPRLMGREA